MTQGKITFKVGQSELTREEELDFNLLEAEYDDEEERKENREKIKVTFVEPLVKEGAKYTGIILPLDLAGDAKKVNTEPTTSKWLTDDNVAFILRNMHYVTDSAVEEDEEKNIYLGNIFCLRTDLANIYHANELAKRLKENKADAKDKEQLEKFKNELNKWAGKYTIFPIALGIHPGNHWGMFILEKNKAYWTSSLNDLASEAKQVKPLIAYLTNEQVADQIDTTTLKGEKQSNSHDCGVYLCLYIKEIMGYETRQDEKIDQPLALTEKYGAETIEKFRNFWKEKIETEMGLGKWCKVDASTFGPSQYPKLIEEALRQGNEVEFAGEYEKGPTNIFENENWLQAINSPYTLKLLPPVKKPLEPNPSTTTGLGTDGHICPYLELPKVEEKFRQQFQGEINDLKKSESQLIKQRNELTASLSETKEEIRVICQYWGTNNLSELSQKLSDEIHAKNDYSNQLNQSQNEIKRLEEKLENERNLKEAWRRECGKIMEMLGSSDHPINNLSHLASLLQGKNLYQIIGENRNLRDAINLLLRKHQANSLEELSQKIIRTEQELANELSWWDDWIAEPDSLNIQLKRSVGIEADYRVTMWKADNKTHPWHLYEEPESKKGRINIKAIYEYYITKRGRKLDTDDKSIKVLEDKILTLIGQDFDSKQIIELRDLFIYNGLPNTYNFIEEVTNLTNNHKIKSLENYVNEAKINLEQNTPEELEEKVNKISPLLLASALPGTQEFTQKGYEEWIKLLRKIDEEFIF
ncbi:Putative Peptidase C48, SUMO/Sentrin/Ubl1 [endosymbiont DhMRE of Dentiscutata heterogama]|uniref:Ulp1 family isopeptidase n=1 Tax=endosymbiont DhMRE of Dentiscutata heterogama TaxID=1609546 RepID=UPI000629D6B4|nr:Ulp1 family isopeptidase [endosymbiont DhMRE of Dentiscutata heterogama]CFW93408.1 Putative Peptidase C48, SUMO/Sentrin/Ubl1 [endosymbiont DhMRE of Dentiscutata heterogama]